MLHGMQMQNILYITNGDGAGDLLTASTLPGDVLPWRDTMHQGPFPDIDDIDEVSRVRAKFLAGEALPVGAVQADMLARNNLLRLAADRDEVILWFEHDLLDQLQLVQILDWFSQPERRPDKLTLICIDDYPGIVPFRGLGQLSPPQIAGLVEQRVPVDAAMMDVSVRVWSAFRKEQPTDLFGILGSDMTALPFLAPALRRHLQEFPSSGSGLTRTEQQLLEIAAEGSVGPGHLFRENMAREDRLHMGDWQIFDRIARLMDAGCPLLRTVSGDAFLYPPVDNLLRDDFLAQQLELTPEGAAALSGDLEPGRIRRHEWLGGVELRSGQMLWTWSEREQCLRHLRF